MKKTKFIAHRGYSQIATENTIDAFEKAASERYFKGIECDIKITKDQKFVVFHDDNTKRLSKVNLVIKDSTYQELQAVNLKNKVTGKFDPTFKIPLFTEYLEICIKANKIAVVEIKAVLTAEQINNLYALIKDYNYLEKTTLISFDLNNLVLLRASDSKIKLEYLVEKFDDDLITVAKNFNLDFNFHKRIPNQKIIKELHKNNIKVNTYTVNSKRKKNQLKALKIDFITTDNTK